VTDRSVQRKGPAYSAGPFFFKRFRVQRFRVQRLWVSEKHEAVYDEIPQETSFEGKSEPPNIEY
jgi:hypothetical protein